MKEREEVGLALFALGIGGALGSFRVGGSLGRLGVFFEAEFVSGMEGSPEDVLGGFGENDVGTAHAAPTARDREKNFGKFLDEGLLLFRSEHEIAVTLLGGGECGENAAVDAEVSRTHVGGFLGTRERECHATEIVDVHGEYGNASRKSGELGFGSGEGGKREEVKEFQG